MTLNDVGNYFTPYQIREAQSTLGDQLTVDAMDHMVLMINYRIGETRRRGRHSGAGLVVGLKFLHNLRTIMKETRLR